MTQTWAYPSLARDIPWGHLRAFGLVHVGLTRRYVNNASSRGRNHCCRQDMTRTWSCSQEGSQKSSYQSGWLGFQCFICTIVWKYIYAIALDYCVISFLRKVAVFLAHSSTFPVGTRPSDMKPLYFTIFSASIVTSKSMPKYSNACALELQQYFHRIGCHRQLKPFLVLLER